MAVQTNKPKQRHFNNLLIDSIYYNSTVEYMRMFFAKFSLPVMLAVITTARCTAQESNSDSVSVNNAATFFNKSIGHESMLYNGPEYHYGNPTFKGNAFFQDVNVWQPGSVNYDGVGYHDVLMRYDLYYDLVVVQLYNKFSSYSLLSPRVADFTLLGHHFVRIAADDIGDKNTISPGFYDQLYAGKIQILVKRSKNLQTNASTLSTLETQYLPKTEYFLKKGNNYYSFGSKGSLLSILKDRNKDIEKYLKADKIKYKDDPETNMVRIASFYDHLTN